MNYRRMYLLTFTYSSFHFSSFAYSETNIKLKSNSFKPYPISSATYNANNPTEDRMIPDKSIKDIQCLAIFDGHGGWQVSEFASQTIFQQLEQNIMLYARDKTDISKISVDDKVYEDDNMKAVLQKTFQDVETSYVMCALFY